MSDAGARRQELAEAATDYVLEHGLLGLSLRPLAAALSTSDRMLLYHFTDKDDLVATVLRTSNDRSMSGILALRPAPNPRAAVHELWHAVTTTAQARCQRLYVEAAALGVLGREPYARVVNEANAQWLDSVSQYLTASGVPATVARRAAALVDATFMGLQLDQQLDGGAGSRAAVGDLADAVAALWPAGLATAAQEPPPQPAPSREP